MLDSELAQLIDDVAASKGRPIVVGISGFGGAGKTTLAQALTTAPGVVGVRGDDFLDPVRSHRRSPDWDGVDRVRLVDEVLCPFREGRSSLFRPFDWSMRELGDPRPVPSGRVLVVDLIGLFHPDALGAIDLAVWCDVDLETATERGMRRDAELGRDHARLWRDIWVPNEIDFAESFRPRERAQAIVETA